MGKVFCIDVAKCSGCYNCQFACKDEHCNNEWLPYAAKQPMTGQFWLKVNEHVQGTKPKVKIHYMPVVCNHCEKPACMEAARNGAVYKRDDGLVIIDPEKAVGQKEIADACPYGAVYWNEELKLPQKCTGCAHLLDEGRTVPRCVDVCHTGAIMFGDEEEFGDFIDGAEVMLPESMTGPKVFYRNIPGRFIAGTLYDPVEEVVVRGAVCRLVREDRTWECVTDIFGDFWFKELPRGSYDLQIEADGFESIVSKGIDTEKDSVNLGDMPMKKVD